MSTGSDHPTSPGTIWSYQADSLDSHALPHYVCQLSVCLYVCLSVCPVSFDVAWLTSRDVYSVLSVCLAVCLSVQSASTLHGSRLETFIQSMCLSVCLSNQHGSRLETFSQCTTGALICTPSFATAPVLCVLCVLCVGGLFSVIGGPCKRYAVTPTPCF
jgi:hypothetical protein